MYKLCLANEIQYFHFLQANLYVEGSKNMSSKEREVAIVKDNLGYNPGARRGYPIMIEEGKNLWKEGFPFFDLTMIFRDVDEPIYADSCCHYNQLGNDIQSRKIAQTILENWEQL